MAAHQQGSWGFPVLGLGLALLVGGCANNIDVMAEMHRAAGAPGNGAGVGLVVSEATRKSLSPLTDYNSIEDVRADLTGLMDALRTRFGAVAIYGSQAEAAQAAGSGQTSLTMVPEIAISPGAMSFTHSNVVLTGNFLDRSQRMVESVTGKGTATIPFPAIDNAVPGALNGAVADFGKNLDASATLRPFMVARGAAPLPAAAAGAAAPPAPAPAPLSGAAFAALPPREKMHRLRAAIIENPRDQSAWQQATMLLLEFCDVATAESVIDAALKANPNQHAALDSTRDLVLAAKGDTASRARLDQSAAIGLTIEIKTATVTALVPGGAAEAAGVKPGDRILLANGAAIDEAHDFVTWLAASAHPGDRINLRINRAGQAIDLAVVVGSRLSLVPAGDPRACAAQAANRDGVADARQGRMRDALEKFNRAIAASPAPGMIPKAVYNAGLAEEGNGRTDAALALYREAFADYFLADDRFGALNRMVGMAQRNAISVPETIDQRYRLGLIRVEQKRYPEAIEAIESALAEAPWIADAYNNLGLIYDTTNQYGKALDALEIYVHLKPTAPNIGNVKTKIVELQDRFGMIAAPPATH